MRIATLARLMSPDLPQFIEPARLAATGETLAGNLATAEMSRLRAAVEECGDKVRIRLDCRRDEQGYIVISGEVDVEITLRCQRCLEPLPVHLQQSIRIGWVTDASVLQRLPEALEPLLSESTRLALATLIEDEILLGLPMAPLHDAKACPAAELVEELKPHRESPFAVLKDLKLKKP